jgi:ribose transport system permease protein
VLALVLAGLVLLFGVLGEHFFSALTFRTLANQIPPLLVVATGLTLVLAAGGIDLSVGSVLALSSALVGRLVVESGWPLPLAASAALLAGLLCGLASGSLTVRWRIPSFIVTLGMLEIARGGTYMVLRSQTRYVGEPVAWLAQPIVGIGLSMSFLLAILVVVGVEVVLRRTVFGRHLLAVGGNEEAARLSGVACGRTRVATFAAAGTLAALGGILQTAYLESSDPNAGIGMELLAIAAAVIGGTSLLGGRASAIGTLFGVLIIAVLQAGLDQVGATEPSKRVVTGLVIVAAAIADIVRGRVSAGADASRSL